jgi:hypothetical protein
MGLTCVPLYAPVLAEWESRKTSIHQKFSGQGTIQVSMTFDIISTREKGAKGLQSRLEVGAVQVVCVWNSKPFCCSAQRTERAAQVQSSLTHSSKAPGFNPCTYKVRETGFKDLLFQMG